MSPTNTSLENRTTVAETSNKSKDQHICLWKLIRSQSAFTADVPQHTFPGSGTHMDPYLVEWIRHDTRNPLIMRPRIKWMITVIQAFAFLSITFASSAMSAADPQLRERFGASNTLIIADTSLFILAFAMGPAIWAPLSELYGRQAVCIPTYALMTLFSGALIASKNIGSILVLRFLSGAFGASAITNSGGVVSDMFTARDRAVAMLAFIGAPFLGPSIAPLVCNYLAVKVGWEWVAALVTFFVGTAFLGVLFVPETYHPVLLRRRAARLTKMTGKMYKSKLDDGTKAAAVIFKTAMWRPWALLFKEPIVLLLSLYMAIIYGTMYMEFAAFPIVFTESRGWEQTNSGLSFAGMGIGQIIGIVMSFLDNTRYKRIIERLPDSAEVPPPEARLFPSLIGAILLPVSLFEFAWTNHPSIHWIVCQIGTVGLGISHVLIFLSVANYLVDTYTLYAASALAANTIIRALLGAAFPLFTNPMYERLGIHWGSSIPAFLALICTPFPYLFHAYGARIRSRCKYAAESARIIDELHNNSPAPAEPRNGDNSCKDE